MPYMPTNFYPKNCAIDIGKTVKYLTWSADLDKYDSIDKAEIIIYNYYSKNPIASIILKNSKYNEHGIATIRFATDNYGHTDWWEPEYDDGNFTFNDKDEIVKLYDAYEIRFTNQPLFPMTSESGFKFDLPLELSSDFTVERIKSKNNKYLGPIDDEDEYYEIFSSLLLDNFKYYWILSVSSTNTYDSWVTDGYIEKMGVAGIKQYYKTFPNSYIAPQGEDIFDFENAKAYTEQKIYNESSGKQYSFCVENGTGYFNETGTALKIGYYKSDKYEVKTIEDDDDKTTTINNYYYKRYAIFDRVINCFDNQGQSIFGTKKTKLKGDIEAQHRFRVCDVTLNAKNIPVIENNGKQTILGVGGTPREPETLELTIDVYKFPVKNIYTMAYYYPAKAGNKENDFLLLDAASIMTDQNFRPIKIIKDANDTVVKDDEGKTTIMYLDELDETNVECLKGPYTIVEYEDAENLFPLWNEKEALEGDDIQFQPETGSIVITPSTGIVVMKELSGQYLELNRTKTTLRIDVDEDEQNNLAFSVGDYFQIKSNSVASFENYYETVSDLRVVIYETDLFEEEEETKFRTLTLSGPSCSFTGKFGKYTGNITSNAINMNEIKVQDFEWSYWEIYKTSYHKTEGVELGKELVYISEKDYSRNLFLTYNNFTNINETADYVRTYYEIVLYVKDKRNIVFSSAPVKVYVDIKGITESGLLETEWDEEKQGIYVNFANYMPSVKAVSYAYSSAKLGIGKEQDKIIGGKPDHYAQLLQDEQTYNTDPKPSYMFLDNERAAYIGSLKDTEYKINHPANNLMCYFVFKLNENDFNGDLFSMYFNSEAISRKTLNLMIESTHTYTYKNENKKDVFGILPDRIKIVYNDIEGITQTEYLDLAYTENEGDSENKESFINPDIIRKIANSDIKDKIKNHYLDTNKTYSFTEGAQFLADDILNCNEPISCLIYFDDGKINILLQIPYYHDTDKNEYLCRNYVYRSGKSFYSGNATLNRVDFYPRIGYREFLTGYKYSEDNKTNYFEDKFVEKIDDDYVLQNAIGKESFKDTNFGNPEKGQVTLYKNFGVGNPLNFSVGSDELLDWDHTMLYRYCYDPDTKEILTILLVSDFYCPNRKFWDYSVSNRYEYSYVFVPVYKRITELPYEEYITNIVSSSGKRIRPTYEDTAIFSATSLYSKDRIYYINPYENSNHRWSFLLDTNDDSISFTTESSVTAGAKYAKVAKSEVIYMQGQVTAKLGKLKDESTYYKDDFYSLQLLKQFLNKANMKMLRLKNGMCIPVDTQIKTATGQSKLIGNPTDISFDWFQIENEEDFFFYEPVLITE